MNIKERLKSIPVVGFLLRWSYTLLRLNNLKHRVLLLETKQKQLQKYIDINIKQLQEQVDFLKLREKQLQEHIDIKENELKELIFQLTEQQNRAINTYQKQVEKRFVDAEKVFRKDLDEKLSKEIFENHINSTYYIQKEIQQATYNLKELIQKADKKLPKTQAKLLSNNLKNAFLDRFYVEFEDRFRGTKEQIKQKLSIYLPEIQKLSSRFDDISVLDIGCGRGEWLELLKEKGFTELKGIDINTIMIEISKELDLDVQKADAIEYLKKQEDESITVITAFHVIEHLSFEVLVEFYDQVLRVLQKGGMLICETPNPQNIFVGACNFYTDPTHKNPIPPQTSKFFLEQRGFKDVKLKFLPSKKTHYDDLNLNYLFASSTDYAVIGYKR